MITIVIASILGITLAVWLVNRALPFYACPICAGVSGTWLWMLGASFLGHEIDRVIVAMLLGGSVVGIAYQLEKKLAAGKSPLLWKALFIPAGFVGAYSLVVSQWSILTGAVIAAGLLAWMFLSGSRKQQTNSKVEELKKNMENCC